MYRKRKCPWCADPAAGDTARPDLLCIPHLAEYEGLTVDELQRMEREQQAEWADTL